MCVEGRLVAGKGHSDSVVLPAAEAGFRKALAPFCVILPPLLSVGSRRSWVWVCVHALGRVMGANGLIGMCRPPLPSHKTLLRLSAPRWRAKHVEALRLGTVLGAAIGFP